LLERIGSQGGKKRPEESSRAAVRFATDRAPELKGAARRFGRRPGREGGYVTELAELSTQPAAPSDT